MKISKAFFWFAIACLLFSVVSAVYGYELDNNRYLLDITGVEVTSPDTVTFSLSNPNSNAFDFTTLHYYTIEFNSVKTATKFSHSLDDPLPVIGMLGFAEKKEFDLPYDSDNRVGQVLECKKPVTIEFYTFKGKLVARYLNIPDCGIKPAPKPGLHKINNCSAIYSDDILRIKWEFIDADEEQGMIKLRKTVGAQQPIEGWYDTIKCPDLESGKCVTSISSLIFTNEGVSFTLTEQRKGTSVMLSNITDGVSCFRNSKQTNTQIIPEQTPIQQPAEQQVLPVQIAEPVLVQANQNSDVRTCLQGCKAQNECYDDGTRANYLGKDVYCSGASWIVQKKDGAKCEAANECMSEKCSRGMCGDVTVEQANILTRFLQWLDDLL